MDVAMLRQMMAAMPPGGLPGGAPPEAVMQMLSSMPPGTLEELMANMPTDLAARGGVGGVPGPPRGVPPGRRQAAKAARGAPGESDEKVYEEALRAYCAPRVVQDFDCLGGEARGALLKALQVAVEETCMSLMRSREGALPAGDVDPACPLVRALRLNRDSGPVSEEEVSVLIDQVLPSWGVVRPKHIALMRHDIGYRQYREKYANGGANHTFTTLTTNSTVVKPAGSGDRRNGWSALKPVSISELKLFEVAKGRVLSGVLVGDPIVQVGIATMLEDDSGSVIQLGLYNQLPGGITGQHAIPVGEKHFARGTRLRVAEPFLKIFRDGNRGLRIDDPFDVELGGGQSKLEGGLESARQDGKKLVEAKKYCAAARIYWQGLQASCSEVVTLLSNRAQAQLKLGAWAAALADAGAALVLSPEHAKAWARYMTALERWGQKCLVARSQRVQASSVEKAEHVQDSDTSISEVRMVLSGVLGCAAATAAADVGAAAELKEEGNLHYKAGRWSDAAASYSAAISACPAAAQAALLLSNAALCSLQTGALHDAVSASSASLRLRLAPKPAHHCAKALALLGEYTLASEALCAAERVLPQDGAVLKQLRRLRTDVSTLESVAKRARAFPDWWSALNDGDRDLFPEWLAEDAVEMGTFGWKGRGLRARRAIEFGQVLLVQRPRGSGVTDLMADGGLSMSTNHDSRLMDDGSKMALKAEITSAVHSDAVLASTLSKLCRSRADAPPPVPVACLMNWLRGDVLPLLLQHPKYFPPEERVEIGAADVGAILDINCHGASTDALKELGKNGLACPSGGSASSKLLGGSTELYPTISLMNHSSDPTCINVPVVRGGRTVAMLVATRRALRAGDELTVSYMDDAEEVERKWGITG